MYNQYNNNITLSILTDIDWKFPATVIVVLFRRGRIMTTAVDWAGSVLRGVGEFCNRKTTSPRARLLYNDNVVIAHHES